MTDGINANQEPNDQDNAQETDDQKQDDAAATGEETTGGGRSLVQKIQGALQNLVELQIVTAIAPVVKDDDEAGNKYDLSKMGDAKIIVTKIDMLQGDITTWMDKAFVSGPYAKLREYHAEKEKQGSEIIRKNIEALQSLLGLDEEAENKRPK